MRVPVSSESLLILGSHILINNTLSQLLLLVPKLRELIYFIFELLLSDDFLLPST